MRASQEFLRAIDQWRRTQHGKPSRAEAIRQLVEKALSTEPRFQRARTTDTPKAAEMAGGVIDQMTDKSQSVEEQQRRKRRLIKGPHEFRDMRKK
jgi:hypothetical protein